MSVQRHTHNTAAEINHSVQDSAYANASAMQKYFGPLRNSEVDTFASDAFAHETHNLPRAYVGRNKFLMATIDFLITKDDDWYTRFVLPWLYTEELHVKWNIWRFNRTMMDYEPEQGVPRYVSYESESRSDSLVRRGLAFIIEHGFYKTELGRQHYLMNLKQIVEAVHETVYFGVMHELVASPNFYHQWQKKHGSHSIMSNNTASALAEERWRFACVQKDIKGLFILDAEIKDRMRRVGIEPNSWIFPSKMAIYASMVPEYFNEFIRAGESASSALETGAKRFNTFRGSRVFETRPFDTDFMAEGSVEPLMRDREIGEFYVYDQCQPFSKFRSDETSSGAQLASLAVGAASYGAEIFTNAMIKGGSPGDKDSELPVKSFINFQHWVPPVNPPMKIFDMSRDQFHKIQYKDILKHSWKGTPEDEDGNGDIVDYLFEHYRKQKKPITSAIMREWGFGWVDNNQIPTDETNKDLGHTLRKKLERIEHEVKHLRELYTKTGDNEKLAQLDKAITESTKAAKTAKDKAKEEGEFGFEDHFFGLDEDILKCLVRMYMIQYDRLVIPHKFVLFRARMTYRMGTAVLLKGGEELGQTLHGHHDFQLTDDVIHKTHIGHYTFYSKSVVREPKNMYLAEDVYCAGYIGGENTAFLTEANAEDFYNKPVTTDTPSLIAIAVPYDYEVPAVMALNGSFEDVGITFTSDSDFCTSPILAEKLKHFLGDTSGDNEDEFKNAICFRGAEHKNYGSGYMQTQQNTGHWGPSVYDGCASVRQGMYAHLRPPGDQANAGITY